MSELCYACPAVATTSEHVPPLCLFPERKDRPEGDDLRRNLITVPACAMHNTNKSGEDVYLWHVLTLNRDGNAVAVQQARTKLSRATRRAPALFLAMTEEAVPVECHARTGEAIDADELPLDGARFESAMDLLARALHLWHFTSRWTGSIKIVPEFIVAKSSAEDDASFANLCAVVDLSFANAPVHGENPSVFSYQVVDFPKQLRAMRLAFYEGTRVAVFFEGQN